MVHGVVWINNMAIRGGLGPYCRVSTVPLTTNLQIALHHCPVCQNKIIFDHRYLGMATSEYEGGTQIAYSRLLSGVYDTMCKKLNLKTIGPILTSKESTLSRIHKKYVKKAMKEKSNKIFCSALQKFDLEGFTIFLDALNKTIADDENHKLILSMICSNLDNLHSSYLEELTNLELIRTLVSLAHTYNPKSTIHHIFEEKLSFVDVHASEAQHNETSEEHTGPETQHKIIAGSESFDIQKTKFKHVGISGSQSSVKDRVEILKSGTDSQHTATTTFKANNSGASTLTQHTAEHSGEKKHLLPTESYKVIRGPFNIYSQSYGITVLADENIIPEGDMDSFDLQLTVNDRSNRITLPDDYTGTYSALVSLECDPKIEMFLSDVMVTIPHCAIGDMDTLCVLSSHDGYELTEDLDIEIADIDQHYISFKTKHFTRYRVSKSKRKPKQKRNFRARKAKSFDKPMQQLDRAAVLRSQSCPVPDRYHCNGRLCAVLCLPNDKSAPHWDFFVWITKALPVYLKVSYIMQQLTIMPFLLSANSGIEAAHH